MAKFSNYENKLIKKITNDRYKQSLGNIREAMEDIWNPDIPRIVPYFTDHGIKHCENLAKIAYSILLTRKKSLSNKELYLLLAGIYLHDIGMQCDTPSLEKIKIKALNFKAEYNQSTNQQKYIITEGLLKELNTPKGVRENHNYISAAWIDYAYNKKSDPIFGRAISSFPEDIHIDDLIDICLYHTKLDINQCPEHFKDEPSENKQLVAALLRFSDELDIDVNRVSSPTILQCFNLDPNNLKYWWLHRHTKISFIDNNKISIVIRLNPVDIDRCGEYIKYNYIEIFIFKNRPIIDVIVGSGFPIILKEFSIKGDKRSDILPPEIVKVLQENNDGLRKEEAIKVYNKAIVSNPADHKAWNNKGVMLFELGNYADSLICYDIALKIKPDDAEYWNNKGNALSYLGKFVEALGCYDEALKIVPNYSNAWYNKGNTLSYHEDLSIFKTPQDKHLILEDELKCFHEVTLLEPSNVNALSNKGNVLCKLNRRVDALDCYNNAIKLDPTHTNTWFNKGYALDDLGDKKGAIECFNNVLKLDVKNLDAWFWKGYALDDLGDKKGAIECFNQVIELNPNYQDIWYEKGLIHCELDETEIEIECYYKNIEINPLHLDSWYNLGVTYENLKKYDDALNAYNFILTFDNKSIETWKNKGDILLKLGKEKDAKECYNTAKILETDKG